MYYPSSASDLKDYGTIADKAMQNIATGEESYIDYTFGYNFA